MLKADRILVFVGGTSADDPAVSRAYSLARNGGSRVMLLDVFDELPSEFEPLISSLKMKDAREEAQRERRGQLSRICEHLHEHGVAAHFDVRWGRPAIELVHEAVTGGHDLLVMEDDLPRGIRAATQSVVRHCPTPVWVVKDAPHVPPPRVLAAIDPIGAGPGAFDRRVLETASGAAQALGAELYVVHAWQPLHDEFGWLPVDVRRMSESEEFIEETRARHAHAMEAVVRSVLPRLPAQNQWLVEGPPARAVLDAASDIGADLVVIGTARSALYARVLIGKTAETILESVGVSVLAVKPDGFVSPLSA